MAKAIIKVGEDGADIELPNGKIAKVSRDDDSVTAVAAVLEALDIEIEYTDKPPYMREGVMEEPPTMQEIREQAAIQRIDGD